MIRNSLKINLIVFSCIFALAGCGGNHYAARTNASVAYQVYDLGECGRNEVDAYAINDLGHVVGTTRYGSAPRAVIWEDGKRIDLNVPIVEYGGSLDIDNMDQVLVSADGKTMLWQDGAIKYFETPSGTSGGPSFLNERGEAAGNIMAYSDLMACKWTDSACTTLGSLPGYNASIACGINNRGQVVGYSFKISSGIGHAYIWENGSMRDLGTLGGSYSTANDINDAGWIVGTSSLPDNLKHAFIWKNGRMMDLGVLTPAHETHGSEASAINELGQVVGCSYEPDYQPHAFIWQNGVMKDLNDCIDPQSGWMLNWATRINSTGMIIGWGKLNGTNHYFLLIPT